MLNPGGLIVHVFRVSLLTIGILSIGLVSCGGKQNGTPPTFSGEAVVGAVQSVASPAPGQTGWPCTVEVFTSGSSTPTSTNGTCGTAALAPAPPGAASCQVTLPDGSAAVGWCLANNGASPAPSASASASATATPVSSSSPTSSTYLYVSPSTVSLDSQNPSQSLNVLVNSGPTPSFTVTIANSSIASVSPTSGAGPFTVTKVSAGNTTITVSDAAGNTITVPVVVQ
jgi:hypothetical protein